MQYTVYIEVFEFQTSLYLEASYKGVWISDSLRFGSKRFRGVWISDTPINTLGVFTVFSGMLHWLDIKRVFVQTVKLCLPKKANFFKKIDESATFCWFPKSLRKITSLELFKILWNAFILICGILETFLHRKFSTFYHIWREAKFTMNMNQIVKRILFRFLKMKVDIYLSAAKQNLLSPVDKQN
jgi:hypothetical protein